MAILEWCINTEHNVNCHLNAAVLLCFFRSM